MSAPSSSTDLVAVAARVADALGERAERDAPLGALTTYRVGGTAAVRTTAHDLADLAAIAHALRSAGADRSFPVIVVGRGSNLLVADAGFPGLAVLLGDGFNAISIEGTEVVAGAAVLLPVLARRTVAAGLTGFEWAVGVPGSVGGAVRMNAGGHGSDLAASLVGVRVVDLRTGEDREVAAAALRLGFRSSALRDDQVVTSARLRLAAGDRAAGEAALAEIVRWRREHQPGGQNAGSVFVNPRPDSAGRLVDSLGLRGLRLGTAQVSVKHANFIQADEGGSADDVLALMREVRARVLAATGIALRSEIRLVGFPEEPW